MLELGGRHEARELELEGGSRRGVEVLECELEGGRRGVEVLERELEEGRRGVLKRELEGGRRGGILELGG